MLQASIRQPAPQVTSSVHSAACFVIERVFNECIISFLFIISIPSGNPDTTTWGTPVVAFNGGSGCNIDSFFNSQQIVFDTTFCGQWAGAVWGDSCSSLAATCVDYVANNPTAFQQSYWEVNSIKVYQ